MNRISLRIFASAALLAAVFAAGTYVAVGDTSTRSSFAFGAFDNDVPLEGVALQRATTAALAYTGGGTVVDSENGDDGAAYSVEIRLPDGSQVEVNLDANYNVTGSESDDDSGPDDD